MNVEMEKVELYLEILSILDKNYIRKEFLNIDKDVSKYVDYYMEKYKEYLQNKKQDINESRYLASCDLFKYMFDNEYRISVEKTLTFEED